MRCVSAHIYVIVERVRCVQLVARADECSGVQTGKCCVHALRMVQSACTVTFAGHVPRSALRFGAMHCDDDDVQSLNLPISEFRQCVNVSKEL